MQMHTKWKITILPCASADGPVLVKVSPCCHVVVPIKQDFSLERKEEKLMKLYGNLS
jgi:hypothetical protein